MGEKRDTLSKRKDTLKVYPLRAFSKKLYGIINEYPTIKAMCHKTGKPDYIVKKTLYRLIKRKYVERINRGIYKRIHSTDFCDGVVKPKDTLYYKSLYKGEYYRLHSIEIRLKINSIQHRHIKTSIFNNRQHYNVRETATGHYFDCVQTMLITKSNLFIKYPKDFEVTADDKGILYEKTNEIIINTIKKIESQFRIQLYRKNKINYEFVKCHVAHIKNGFAQEIDKSGQKVRVWDDDDGKLRYIMDKSKGLPEIECIHPDKCFDDSDKLDNLMAAIKGGKIDDIVQYFDKINDIGDMIPNSELLYILKLFMKNEVVNQGNFIRLTDEVRNIVKILALILPKPQEYKVDDSRIEYAL